MTPPTPKVKAPNDPTAKVMTFRLTPEAEAALRLSNGRRGCVATRLIDVCGDEAALRAVAAQPAVARELNPTTTSAKMPARVRELLHKVSVEKGMSIRQLVNQALIAKALEERKASRVRKPRASRHEQLDQSALI